MNSQQKIIKIEQLSDIKDIAVGGYHCIALTGQGIWLWGFSTKQQSIQAPIFMQRSVESACAGSEHSFVWKKNQVFCWGSNKDYKLGLQHPIQYELTKSQIFQQAFKQQMQLSQITCGDSHSMAVFKLVQKQEISHQIFAWGESKSYQLALQTEGVVTEPILIDFNQPIKTLYSRSDYNFIITNDGNCFSWGTNLFGRLGFPNYIKNQKLPSQIKTLSRIKSLSMGVYHCLAITQVGQIFTWGHGMHGQLGLNQIVSQTTPTKIQISQKIIQSACGQSHSLILTQSLELMSCGSNSYFALGHNEVDQKKRCKKFTKIKLDQKIRIVKILSGNRHNLLLSQEGKVYSWGCNKYGQLGRLKQKKSKIQMSRDNLELLNFSQDSKDLEKKLLQQSSPFSQIRGNLSPFRKKEQSNNQIYTKLQDWKLRYQKFKYEQQKQHNQYMKQLQLILKQIKQN